MMPSVGRRGIANGPLAQTFPHPAQQVACREYFDAISELEMRVEGLAGRIRDLLPTWSMARQQPITVHFGIASGTLGIGNLGDRPTRYREFTCRQTPPWRV
jgi:hypothetical protein